MTTQPLPDITDVNRPYWNGLAMGQLRYQTCSDCGNAWLPARERCPGCLSASIDWRTACGEGKIVSWVIYRTAYAPHLVDKVPYNVAIVELTEGPRLLTNIKDAPEGQGLSIGLPVRAVIEREGDLYLPRFAVDLLTSTRQEDGQCRD